MTRWARRGRCRRSRGALRGVPGPRRCPSRRRGSPLPPGADPRPPSARRRAGAPGAAGSGGSPRGGRRRRGARTSPASGPPTSARPAPSPRHARGSCAARRRPSARPCPHSRGSPASRGPPGRRSPAGAADAHTGVPASSSCDAGPGPVMPPRSPAPPARARTRRPAGAALARAIADCGEERRRDRLRARPRDPCRGRRRTRQEARAGRIRRRTHPSCPPSLASDTARLRRRSTFSKNTRHAPRQKGPRRNRMNLWITHLRGGEVTSITTAKHPDRTPPLPGKTASEPSPERASPLFTTSSPPVVGYSRAR